MTDLDTQQLLNQNRRIARLANLQGSRLSKLLEHIAGDTYACAAGDIDSSGSGVLARLTDIANETEESLDYMENLVDALYALFPGVDDPAAEGEDDEEPEEPDAEGSYEDLIAKRDALVAQESARKAKRARKARRAA